METITTQLADSLHGERLREADRARLAVSARAASRSARRACQAATPASRIAAARSQMTASSPRGIFSQAELRAKLVTRRIWV